MEGPQLERWRELCAQIAEENDPVRFSELVNELLQELDKKKQRLPGGTGQTAAD